MARGLAAASCAMAAVLVPAASLAPAAGAAASPGKRVTVALFGDSVTESVLVSNFLKNGLAPQLERAEPAFGFTLGGPGLIPAAPFRWHFNRWVAIGQGTIPANGWEEIGYGTSPALDGPSEYSAVTTSPEATATTKVSNRDITVLYSTTDEHCPFTVSAAGHTWSIDTYSAGAPTDTETPLVMPPGTNVVTVRGPSCGVLWFDGIVAQRPVSPGKPQLEVDNLGHSGKPPWDGLTTRVEQAVAEQHYNISVFLYAYIAEVLGIKEDKADYLPAMLTRARIAREHGGACLIVAPTPMPASASLIAAVTQMDRTVARRAGCTYTTALTHLWSSPAAAERRGLVLVDGVHPTPAGYALMVHVLAPIIARMAHAQLAR